MHIFEFEKTTVLIIVDVQNDFLPGGSLAVPHGNEVIGPLRQSAELFAAHGFSIFATRCWHPPDHCSFQQYGGRWPAHCIQGSFGAAFASSLGLPRETKIISKGNRRDLEAYSGFDGTDLHALLQERAITRLVVGGLATDYCVLNTALDGRRLGYDVFVLTDAVRPVAVLPGDEKRALDIMARAGVIFMDSREILTKAA